MIDITDFKADLRNFLLADSTITTLVSSRVYWGELFTLNNPVYPTINITFFEGRELLKYVDRIGVNIYCSSKVSYDEADQVCNAINNMLNSAHVGNNSVYRLQMTPINRLIENPIPIYQTICRYIVYTVR